MRAHTHFQFSKKKKKFPICELQEMERLHLCFQLPKCCHHDSFLVSRFGLKHTDAHCQVRINISPHYSSLVTLDKHMTMAIYGDVTFKGYYL